MAKKGQTFKKYSFVLKKKEIEIKLRGNPHAKIAEELGIQDVGRLKVYIT
jgi:transposase